MLKYAKIENEETKECSVGLGDNADFYKSIGMTEMEVEENENGKWYVAGFVPVPTEEEQKEKRAFAYQQEVDPITSQISRLRDEEQTPEIIEKINELLQKRSDTVKDIQERYPYPVD